MVFSFYIQPYARWSQYGAILRRHLTDILSLLRDPCSGSRLRQVDLADSGTSRWDDFCKFELPGTMRILYRVVDDLVLIEMVGFHLGSGQLGDVYDALSEVHDLPSSAGHKQIDVEPCCTEVAPADLTVDGARALRKLRSLTSR